jgi:hypothetical protein
VSGDLFEDAAEAARRRDAAIEQADRGAREAWREAAFDALKDVVMQGRRFTADDVWRRLGATDPELASREPRAMGAVLMRGKRAGLCEPTADFLISDRPSNHRRPERVWRRTQPIGDERQPGPVPTPVTRAGGKPF